MNPLITRLLLAVMAILTGTATQDTGTEIVGYVAGLAGVFGGLALPEPRVPVAKIAVFTIGAALNLLGLLDVYPVAWMAPLAALGSGLMALPFKPALKPTTSAATATSFAFAALLLALPACAGSVRAQAITIDAAHDVLATVGHAIEAGATQAWAQASAGTTSEVELQQAAVRARWQPAYTSYSAARTAYNAWIDAVQAADSGGPPVHTGIALGLARSWRALAADAAALGIKVPAPPGPIAALGGGP